MSIQETFNGIILRSTPYAEHHRILSVFTHTRGVQSFFLTQNKKNAHIHYAEGSIISFVTTQHHLQRMARICEISYDYVFTRAQSEVHRNLVLSFVIDLFRHSVHFPEENAKLFFFLRDTLVHIDHYDRATLAHVPLYFSAILLQQSGFAITEENCPRSLSSEMQQLLIDLCALPSLPAEPSTFRITPALRRPLLDSLLTHYMEYVPAFKIPPSLRVIQEILH